MSVLLRSIGPAAGRGGTEPSPGELANSALVGVTAPAPAAGGSAERGTGGAETRAGGTTETRDGDAVEGREAGAGEAAGAELGAGGGTLRTTGAIRVTSLLESSPEPQSVSISSVTGGTDGRDGAWWIARGGAGWH